MKPFQYLRLSILLLLSICIFSSCNNDDDNSNDIKVEENNSINTSSEVNAGNYQQQVLALVNKARKEEGVPPLKLNNELNKAAFNHSEDMLNQDYFSHTGKNGSSFSERARKANYTGSPMGENIAWGQRSPESVVNAWLNSSGHRRNMLNSKATEMGIGRSSSGNYWTQILGRQ